LAVREPDDKGRDTMHARAVAREQLPRALLAARHQRPTLSVQHKNSQRILLESVLASGQGGPSFRRSARKGLVTGALRRRSLRQSCVAASGVATLAADRFGAPAPCLLLRLSAPGTQEASRGESCTSTQRSVPNNGTLSLVSRGFRVP